MKTKRLTWSLVLLLGLAAACKSRDNTGIVVEVWSDLPVPLQLNGVRIEVLGPTANQTQSFPLSESGQIPVRMAVVPRAEKNASILVRVTGLLGPAEIVQQSTRASFIPGSSKLLRLNLERTCVNAGCGATQSCTAGKCIVIPTAQDLPDYDPKTSSGLPDAARPANDADTDSEVEAGVARDASPDHAFDGLKADGPLFDGPSVQVPDAPLGAGGTDGGASTAADTGGALAAGGSSGGLAGNSGTGGASPSSSTGGRMGGSAGSDAGTPASTGIGAGGSSGPAGSGGAGGTGGFSTTEPVIVSPDAGIPIDAPVGGSAGGTSATGGVSATGGASPTGGVGGVSTTGGASASAVTCESLSDPANGSVNVPATAVGSSASYSCSTGYKLSGQETRNCEANGTWSGSAPTCVLVDCGSAPSLSNGTANVTTTTYNSIATYSCTTTGYTISGTATLTCQADGSWSLPAPTCVLVDCGGLPPLPEGSVSAPITTYDATATYACTTPGYVLSGSPTRKCQADKTWSGSAPTCMLSELGMVCSASAQCPEDSRCCDGSEASCLDARLTGDSTPASQFVVSQDQLTVADNLTGLVWQRTPDEFPAGCTATLCTWSQAVDYCNNLTLGGFTDWRLPSAKELTSIVQYTLESYSSSTLKINQLVFFGTPSASFWTSSEVATTYVSRWQVNFASGTHFSARLNDPSPPMAKVRCVR